MNKKWTALWLTLFGFAVFCPFASAADEPTLDTLEQLFRELPADARRLTGPLFWLHGDESVEHLAMYVGKVAEGGNGCFTAESRPHNDWLGEAWYRDLAICLAAAKKHNLKMWIFDEKWWPSGEVGGKVPPQYGTKRLVGEAKDVKGPARFEDAGYGGPNFIAAIAGRSTAEGIDGASLIDLAASIRDGRLVWDAPAGDWKVMKFTWQHDKGRRRVVDGASQDCVDWYIRTVYQPHYDRFKDDFGKSIAGYFYDEPETHGDWGAELPKVLAERNVDWKKAYVAWKFQLVGDEQPAARYQYQDALAEAWGRTLYGGLSRWCRKHSVLSIGHFLEHNFEYLHPELCAGNMFQLQKYSDMGAIDAVFKQFAPGTRDPGLWQTPKLGSSITHAYGKPDDIAMVEIFGARGQDLTYPEMKWWTDLMHVAGINFHIPHSFNPRSPYDTDCPPYFYNNGFEPRWPLYRVYADYTSRLSLMLSGGRHVCPVALLFLGGSRHVGRNVTPEQMSTALQDALYDCDWIPYEVFENDIKIAGKELSLRQEDYRVLIVPPVEVIPIATLAKAKEFFDQGGVVIGYGFLPSKSATLGRASDEIAALCRAIWGDAKPGLAVCKTNAAGGRSYLLPEQPTPEQLQKVLAGDANIHPTLEVLEGDTGHWLHVLHRTAAGRDVFFITNQNHTGQPRRFRFRIKADGVPECWDAMRNEITAVPHSRDSKYAELAMTFEPSESVLLVFQPQQRALPQRIEPGETKPVRSIAIQRDPTPPAPDPTAGLAAKAGPSLEGLSWVWYPEGGPAQSAAPGNVYFRKSVTIPEGRKVKKAVFYGTADNSFRLFVNGSRIGSSDASDLGWRNPVEHEIAKAVKPGANVIAIAANNATDQPNAAGLIGRLTIEFEQGEPMGVAVDATWKASKQEQAGWTNAAFDDAAWPAAKLAAPFGGGPWGSLTKTMLTLSPVKSHPFAGDCELPADADLKKARVCLEMDSIAPEAAARITINEQDAGGFIERPLRLDVTRRLKPGANRIVIEPFAPPSARLVFYAPAAAGAAAAQAADEVALSALDLSKIRQGWGAARANQAVTQKPLSIAGETFANGVGTHARSVILVNLGGGATRFRAVCGVDDNAGKGRGSIQFRVVADGKTLWRSPVMKQGNKGERVDLDVSGVKTLVLLVSEADNGSEFDHADWADARIVVTGARPQIVAAPAEEAVILTPPAPPEPRINGPKVYGGRPGNPFLYRIPATGERPMQFAADNLPAGLRLDAATGIIAGTNPPRGEYAVTLRAKNARGESARSFKIVSGDTLALTPPMGWNHWYTHYDRITDALMRQAADVMIASGMADVGYQYVNIDDCWPNAPEHRDPLRVGPLRDAQGNVLANKHFPDMKALTDYIHAKGLKAGIYTSPGPFTCARFTGAWQHEEPDARRFAEWGFDFLKHDWCSYGKVVEGRNDPDRFKEPYILMGGILKRQPRDIVLNLCQYGMGNVWEWGAEVGGHSWRTGGDLGFELERIFEVALKNVGIRQHNKPGAWNDPDYIQIGWIGNARGGGEPRPCAMTPTEQYAFMSLWCLMASPLFFSGDMGQIDAFTLNVLCNPEVIEIDQDPLGQCARLVGIDEDTFILVKDLEDGSRAVGLCNRGEWEAEIVAPWAALGLAGRQKVRDLWRQKDLGVFEDAFRAKVPRRGVVLVRVAPAASR